MPSVVAQNCAPRPWAERHAARGYSARRQGRRQHRWVAVLSVRSEALILLLPGNRPTRGLRQSIGRATAAAQGGGGDQAGALWTVHAARGAGRGCSYGGGRDQRRHRHGGCCQGQQQEGGQGDGARTASPQPPAMQARSGNRGTVRPSPVKEPGLQEGDKGGRPEAGRR